MTAIAAPLPDRLGTALLATGVVIGVMFTVLLAGGSAALESVAVRTVYLVLLAIALIPWLVIAAWRPAWRPASNLALGIVACLAAMAVATLTSRVPRLSVEALAYAVLLAEAYLLLVALMRRPALRDQIARLALVIGVLVAALYLAQATAMWLDWWDAVGRVTIPPLRPGYVGLTIGAIPLATLVLLLAAFGLAASPLDGHARRLVTTIAVVILVSITVLVAGSRGAWLGAAGALLITAATAVALRPEARREALRRLRSPATAAVIAGGAVLLVAAAMLAAMSGRLTLSDVGNRPSFAEASLQIVASAPLTGSGPGTWQILRAANTPDASPDQIVPHAHNIYLQAFAEHGLVGIVAGLVLAVGVGALILRAMRAQDLTRRRVGQAALFGVSLLAIQQMGDVLVNVPALLFAIPLSIAWLDAAALPPPGAPSEGAAAPPSPGRRRPPAGLGPLLLAGLTVVMLAGLARVESIATVAEQGTSAADAGEWDRARALLGEAAADDPDVPAYQFQLGVAAANTGDLETAAAALARSAAADDFPYAWLNLAMVRLEQGDAAGARAALERAERLGLQRAPVAVGAGYLHERLGDREAALERYGRAVAMEPTLAADPFWDSLAGPPGGIDAVVTALERTASPATLLIVDLVRGRFDTAERRAADLAAADPSSTYPLLVAAWRGDAEARAALAAVAERQPLDFDAAARARLIAVHAGDDAAADRFRRWLTPRNADGPIVARLILEGSAPTPTGVIDGYGALYRRPIVRALVVNLLPQLTRVDRP